MVAEVLRRGERMRLAQAGRIRSLGRPDIAEYQPRRPESHAAGFCRNCIGKCLEKILQTVIYRQCAADRMSDYLDMMFVCKTFRS